MDGFYYGSTGKRSHSYYDSDGADRNSKQKRQAVSNSDQLAQSAPTSGETEYRILCPGSKIGTIIGKGGNVIKSMRLECRSKVKVEDSVPGSDERIIYICSSKEARERSKDMDRNGDKEKMLCAAQEALFRVFEAIIDGQSGAYSDEDDDEPPKSVTARLLVPSNQIGCVIGKGGKIIEQMRRDIGGQIRVLPKEQLPRCASPNDEIVQLSGDPAVVRKALYAISSRLYENPPREQNQRDLPYQQGPALSFDNSLLSHGSLGGSLFNATSAGGSMLGLGQSLPFGGLAAGVGSAWPLSSTLSSLSAFGGSHMHPTGGGPEAEFVIRVLCPNDKVGSMIGKGGKVIRKMREETGAKIKVGEPTADSDECIIEITTKEHLESQVSPAIDAVLQVQMRIAELLADRDEGIKTMTARLLVLSSQIGSLIGKGGSVINEIRKMTRANIRIPPKDERPGCAGENDELVQIAGDRGVVEHALLQVVTRLRNNLFKGYDSGGVIPPPPALPLQGNPNVLSSYIVGRHEPGSPEGRNSLNGLGTQRSSKYSSYTSSPGGAALQASSGRSQKESRRRQK